MQKYQVSFLPQYRVGRLGNEVSLRLYQRLHKWHKWGRWWGLEDYRSKNDEDESKPVNATPDKVLNVLDCTCKLQRWRWPESPNFY